jgi:uncharacterized protein YjlB
MSGGLEVVTFHFADAGEIPNNPRLPLVIYRNAIEATGNDPAERFGEAYARGGWYAAWSWGVYPFPHYHSTAHEVLGVYRGRATLRLGHTHGQTLEVQAGDAIIIPAGVGHQNLNSSEDFHVVGGYPDGQEADLQRGHPKERPAADENIKAVPLPKGDPIFGPNGPLKKHWGLV